MTRSLTIARIQDIDVRLHPTFALVFVWVLLDWRRLGTGQGALTILFTLVLVLLVFACVLLHEFGHAFMARQHGVRVHDVSLSAVGGVARMEQLPIEPRSEMLIALAGPAVNLAFVVALVPVALLIGIASGFSSVEHYALTVFNPSLAGLATTLLYANLLIVAFNMLPAFPMDGGRVFRAGLTALVGREAGTRVAVLVGQAFAVVLLVFSLFVAQSVILALLAVFIFVVAYAEGRAVRIESTLRRLRVGQFALWDMGGIAPDLPIAYALRGGPRDMAVTKEGQVIGMLWRNRLLAELGTRAPGRTVGEVMERDTLTVEIDCPVYDVHQLMIDHNRWAVPVTESGAYRGIFTADRLLHIYRQLTPDPLQWARDLWARASWERMRV
jgi:stage IV sporulation protein FB